MFIGLIDVTKLSTVRETFRLGWRISVSLSFLLLLSLWWLAIHTTRSSPHLTADRLPGLKTFILAAVIVPPLLIALFYRNAFARLIYAVVTALTFLLLLPLLLVTVHGILTTPKFDSGDRIFALGFVFLMVMFCWQSLIRRSYLLFLSVIPFRRWKAYREQVVHSIRLCSGGWKSYEASKAQAKGEKFPSSPGARYRLVAGSVSFLIAVVCIPMAVIGFFNTNFLPAVYHLQFTRVWQMLSRFETTGFAASTWAGVGKQMIEATSAFAVLIFGFICFAVFGFFRNQWQRENMLIFRDPISRHMTPSDLLLLRSFKDDVKYIARTKNSIWRIPFNAYSWAYTFEQLIVDRLSYVGRVRLLDITEDVDFLDKRWPGFLRRLPSREKIKRLLTSVFPAIRSKLPPKGGVRYYVDPLDEQKWKAQIEGAMSMARMIVVVLGTTDSLKWEMDRIQQLQLLQKTIFLMPPLILKRNFQVRWQQFISYLTQNSGYDIEALKTVKSKRVLAVCVSGDGLIIITGKRNTELFYESALDVATVLTVADPEQSRRMIQKRLT